MIEHNFWQIISAPSDPECSKNHQTADLKEIFGQEQFLLQVGPTQGPVAVVASLVGSEQPGASSLRAV